jgi:hypothetical protein
LLRFYCISGVLDTVAGQPLRVVGQPRAQHLGRQVARVLRYLLLELARREIAVFGYETVDIHLEWN